MSLQPDDRTCTARNQRATPTVSEDNKTPLPKDQQIRMAVVRDAKAGISRRNSCGSSEKPKSADLARAMPVQFLESIAPPRPTQVTALAVS
jgi:hypothetical protein